MENYVGLDVSLRQTSICVVNQRGSIVQEGRTIAKTSPAGQPGWWARRSGYYFFDAEADLRIMDELAIPDNQRRK
jgi:hypothetical protein